MSDSETESEKTRRYWLKRNRECLWKRDHETIELNTDIDVRQRVWMKEDILLKLMRDRKEPLDQFKAYNTTVTFLNKLNDEEFEFWHTSLKRYYQEFYCKREMAKWRRF